MTESSISDPSVDCQDVLCRRDAAGRPVHRHTLRAVRQARQRQSGSLVGVLFRDPNGSRLSLLLSRRLRIGDQAMSGHTPWRELRDEMTDEQRLHIEVVLDPKTAAGLLAHAAELLTAIDTEHDRSTEIARWRQDFEDFRDAR